MIAAGSFERHSGRHDGVLALCLPLAAFKLACTPDTIPPPSPHLARPCPQEEAHGLRLLSTKRALLLDAAYRPVGVANWQR